MGTRKKVKGMHQDPNRVTGVERVMFAAGIAILMCIILAGAALLAVPRGVLAAIGVCTIVASAASVYVLATYREKRLSEPRRAPRMGIAPPDHDDKDWKP